MSFAAIAAALGIGGSAAAGVGGAAAGAGALGAAGAGAGALGAAGAGAAGLGAAGAAGAGLGAAGAGLGAAGAGLGTAAGAGAGAAGLGAAIPVAGGSIIPAGLGSTGAGALTAEGLLGAGSGLPTLAGSEAALSGMGAGGGITGSGMAGMGAESVFGAAPNLGGSGAMFSPPAAGPSTLVPGGEVFGYTSPVGHTPATAIPGGYDAAGRAALNPSNVGPVQEAGMFTEGFQPGAYEMGAGDSVSKFTPSGMSNLQKAYIGSQLYKTAAGGQQKTQYPSMSMPGVTAGRGAPQMAPRRPLPMGGFMGGGYKPRLGSRRY
jgi:hypothetical protein